jgi:serine/threonine protein kinase
LGYDLVRELGRGGLGRVYLGTEQAVGDRQVVVKASFEQTGEAGILGNLNHPNIVQVYSVKQDPGTGLSVMCMPYLGEATLKQVLDLLALQPGPWHLRSLERACRQASQRGVEEDDPAANGMGQGLLVEEVLSVARQIADAIAYAHDRGILHRDIKPSNVLMTAAGRPMVLDFNLSVPINGQADRQGGTLPYMAPEQIRAVVDREGSGAGAEDVRDDSYDD